MRSGSDPATHLSTSDFPRQTRSCSSARRTASPAPNGSSYLRSVATTRLITSPGTFATVWRRVYVDPNSWWVNITRRPDAASHRTVVRRCHPSITTSRPRRSRNGTSGARRPWGRSLHVEFPVASTIVNPSKLTASAQTCVHQCHCGQPRSKPQRRLLRLAGRLSAGRSNDDVWMLEEHRPEGELPPDGTRAQNRMQGNDFVQSRCQPRCPLLRLP